MLKIYQTYTTSTLLMDKVPLGFLWKPAVYTSYSVNGVLSQANCCTPF